MGVIIGCLYDNGNGVVKRKKINKGITDTEEVMGEKVLEQVFEQEGRDEIQGTDVGSLLQIREHISSLDITVIKSYGKNAVGGRSSDTRS